MDLASILAGLAHDYGSLSPRLREIKHSVVCECEGVTVRAHFPAIVQGAATVHDLIETMIHFLPWFALPRSQIAEAQAKFKALGPAEIMVESSKLFQAARALFINAHKATNRSGEAGEFLLSILTEWILGAPQLIAKMSLKTNATMPVHGSDGVHGRMSLADKKLVLLWGESKVHANVGTAITDAIRSIGEANDPEKQKHELQLVSRYIDFAGLDTGAKEEFLKFFDPYDEASNKKKNVTTCLIAYNCKRYTDVSGEGDKAEEKFRSLIVDDLKNLSVSFADKLKSKNLEHQTIELFFLPLPSVEMFRKAFQAKVGWTP